jgi:hypothetical protein
MCTGNGAFTAPQYNEFRKNNDARIHLGRVRDQKHTLPDTYFVYGKQNRPQTPVGGIIANEFGERAS